MTPHTSVFDANAALNLGAADAIPFLTGMDALMETDHTGLALAPILHFESPLGENLILGETLAFSPIEDDLAGSGSGDLVGSSRTLLPTAAGDSLTNSDSGPSNQVAAAVAQARESLQSWRDSSRFVSGVQAVYGQGVDMAQAAAALDNLLAGAGALANLQVVDSLGTAAGAYAAANDTIYLAESLLSNPSRDIDDIARVILEELGHALDARLNETDTAGDEGALFAAEVTGQELSAAERAMIAVEDDSATVVIDGQELAIEQFELPDLVGVFADADNDYLIGGQTDFTFRIQNQGTQSVGTFSVNVLYSDNQVLGNGSGELVLERVTIDGGLAANETIERTVSLNLSTRLLNARAQGDEDHPGAPAGTADGFGDYIGIVIDPDNEISESNESNNAASSTATLGQDLDKITHHPWDVNGDGQVSQADIDDLLFLEGQSVAYDDESVFGYPINYGYAVGAGLDFDGDNVITAADGDIIANYLGHFRDPGVSEGDPSIPLAVTLALQSDTGDSNSDRITTDPTISGQLSNSTGITALQVRLGKSGAYTDILSSLEADGSFTLTLEQLRDLNGGSLPTNGYAVDVVAKNSSGAIDFSTLFFHYDAPQGAGGGSGEPLELSLALSNDTGTSDSDRITTDPTLTGQLSDASNITSLQARIGNGSYVDITDTLQADDTFALDTARLAQLNGGTLPEGQYVVEIQAQNAAGTITTTTLDFTYDLPPINLALTLSNDTGNSDSDGLTADPTLSGQLSDASYITSLQARIGNGSYVDISDTLQADGTFTLDTARLDQLNGSPLTEGQYVVEIQAQNAAGTVGTTTLDFTYELPHVEEPNPYNVLLLTASGYNNLALHTDDQIVYDQLVNRGFDVTAEFSGDFQTQNAAGFDLIAITGNIFSSNEVFDDLAVPIISLRGHALDELDLRPPSNSLLAAQINSITITNSTHPLAGGFSGEVQIYDDVPGVIPSIEPLDSAIEIAKFTPGSSATPLLAYEKGTALLNGETAPERRVHFLGNYSELSELNEIGWQLFNVAVDWAMGIGGDSPIDTPKGALSLAQDTGEDGDFVTANPTVSGQFTSTTEITRFEARLGNRGDYLDVSAALQANGQFTFELADLEQLNGGALGTGDYTLTVKAENAAGLFVTEPFTFTYLPPIESPTAPLDVLLLNWSGSSGNPLQEDEQLVFDHLVNRGFNVTTQNSRDFQPQDANDVELLVVTGANFDTPTVLDDLAVPIISMDFSNLDELDLQAEASSLSSQMSDGFSIINETHPISDGFSDTVTIYKQGSSNFIPRMTPHPSATRIGDFRGYSPIFVHDKGATLFNGETAPDKRVVFLGNSSDISKLTEVGWRLFDASVNWAVGLEDGQPSESLELSLALSNDTGSSDSDRITTDPTLTGQLSDASNVTSLQARIGDGQYVDIADTLQADGTFTLDTAQLSQLNGGTLPEGQYVVEIQAQTTAGTVGTTTLDFTYDLPPINLALTLSNDTGSSDSDRLTADPTLSGQLSDASYITSLQARIGSGSYVDISDTLQADGTFTLDTARLGQLNSGTLPEGQYVVEIQAQNVAGTVGTTSLGFTYELPPNMLAPDALLLTLNNALSDSEQAVSDRLSDLGFTVTTERASNFERQDADAAELLVVTAWSGLEANDVSDLEVPVVALARALYDEFQLVPDQAGVWLEDEATVTIEADSHPIVDGIEGEVTLFNSAQPWRDARPHDSATQIITGTNGYSSLFAYEVGDALAAGDVAAARMVAFLGSIDSVTDLSTAGWQLFDNAVSWAASNPAVPALEIDLALNNDTGENSTDDISLDPTIAGQLANAGTITLLQAHLGDGNYVDVSDALQTDGSFTLDEARLTQLSGGYLAYGENTLHVRAQNAAGSVDTLAFTFTYDQAPDAAPDALLLTLDRALSSSEQAVSQRLSDLGFTVITERASDFERQDADYAELLVAAAWYGLDANAVENLEVPVVALGRGLYDEFLLVPDQDGLWLEDEATVTIEADSHPIANGIDGEITLFNTDQQRRDARPLASATQVISGANGYSSLFAYEVGAALAAGEVADARMVAFLGSIDSVADLSTVGWQLFENAVNWVVGGFDEPLELLLALSNDTGSSDSDGLTADPTLSGQLSDANDITVLQARIGSGSYVDIADTLQADGSFELDLKWLGDLNGGGFAYGDYTVEILARAASGAVDSTTMDFSYEFQQAALPYSEGEFVPLALDSGATTFQFGLPEDIGNNAQLLVYLLNENDLSDTLLANGAEGNPLLSGAPNYLAYDPSIVSVAGTEVTVDVSSLTPAEIEAAGVYFLVYSDDEPRADGSGGTSEVLRSVRRSSGFGGRFGRAGFGGFNDSTGGSTGGGTGGGGFVSSGGWVYSAPSRSINCPGGASSSGHGDSTPEDSGSGSSGSGSSGSGSSGSGSSHTCEPEPPERQFLTRLGGGDYVIFYDLLNEEDTFTKPTEIKFGNNVLTLNYSDTGVFEGSSNDELLDVVLASVGLTSLDSLTAAEITANDTQSLLPPVQTLKLQDVWSRIGEVALKPNKDFDQLTQDKQLKSLDFQENLLKATALTDKFAGYEEDKELLKEIIELGNVYAEINSQIENDAAVSFDFWLDTIWNTKDASDLQKGSEDISRIFGAFNHTKNFIKYIDALKETFEATDQSYKEGKIEVLNYDILRDLVVFAESSVIDGLDISELLADVQQGNINLETLNHFQLQGLYKIGIKSLGDLELLDLGRIDENTSTFAQITLPPFEPSGFTAVEDSLTFLEISLSMLEERAANLSARRMFDFVSRYPYIFPGNTPKFFEKYLIPDLEPQNLFAREWELEERIKTFPELIRQQTEFRFEIVPSIIAQEINKMKDENFDIGGTRRLTSGTFDHYVSFTFLPKINPPFEKGTIFSLAFVSFFRNFDIEITRENNDTFSVQGSLLFYLTDSFEDAADYGNFEDLNQEFDGGHPYDVYANWEPFLFSGISDLLLV